MEQYKSSIISLIVLLMIGVTILFLKPSKEQQSQIEEAKLQILNIDKNSILAFDFSNKERKIRAEKKSDGKWHLTQPLEAPVDDQLVKFFLDTFPNLRANRWVTDELPNDPKLANTYGFSKPLMTVHIETKNSEKITFILGKRTQIGQEYFAKLKDSAKVFVVDKNLRERLNYPVDSYRKRQIIGLNHNEIIGLAVKTKKYNWAANQKDGQWNITLGPEEKRADEDKIKQLVRGLANIRAEKFVADYPDAKSKSKFGINTKHATVKLTDKNNQTAELLISAKYSVKSERTDDEMFEMVNVMVKDQPFIYALNYHFVKRLEQTPQTYLFAQNSEK